MLTFQILLLLATLVLPVPREAVVSQAVDRLIAKEADYAMHLPKYCFLVIGPQQRTRCWLVLDGTDLYFDRNGNGDLTEPGERLTLNSGGRWTTAQAGMVRVEGKERLIEFRLRDFDQASGKCAGLMIVLDGQKKLFVGFDPEHPFRFAQRADRAPIVHVEGALEIRLYGEPPTLIAGEEVDLNIVIGTPGVGAGSFCAIQCCTVLDCKVTPTATIAFPARGLNSALPPLVVSISDD